MKLVIAFSCALVLIVLAACASVERAPQPAEARACAGPRAYAAAALYNEAASRNLVSSPFGRPEQGWEIYEPRLQAELHTRCPPQTPGFARALARWQSGRGLKPDGALQPAVLETMKAAWQARRPFVAKRLLGICPDPPAPRRLATAATSESHGGKTVQLRPAALRAYRRMVAAARGAIAEIRADPEALRLFSGYRSPEYDAARCAREHNCDGLARAACSAHRTGLAMDLVVGALPGRAVDSSADDNRLYQSRTPAYRWLTANAQRYGFVNYVFEPWHWEWTGETP